MLDTLSRLAFEASEEAALTIDASGKVAQANRRARSILGRDAAGEALSALFGDGEADRLLELCREADVVRRFRCSLRLAGGAVEPAHARAQRLGDAGFWVSWEAGTGDEAATRDNLERLERFSAVGRMAAVFAHDVRGPLHIISSTAEYALEHLGPAEELRGGLEMIARNAARATASIKALLQFARAGHCELKPGSLNTVVDSIADLVAGQCETRGIAVERRLSETPDVLLDPNHLGAAVFNLVSNAMDAISGSGTVSLATRLEAPEGPVVLEVSDTGGGMDPDVVARLGESFFTTKAAGSGLGLYLTRRIVSEHGGEMSIESRKGRGTTVRLAFRPVLEGKHA